MPTLTLAQATDLVVTTLTRCRTEADNARAVARALVAAEAEGLKGHGLSRVPTYAAQAKVGKVDGFAKPTIEWRRPGVAAVDANNGFAYPAIDMAVAALPKAARQNGIAAAAIRRSHHCGAAGHPVERLAEAGLVGADVRQHAGGDRTVGRRQGRVRHQSNRVFLPASWTCRDRRGPVAFEGGARQYSRGQAERRSHSKRLGARFCRQADDGSGRGTRRHHAAARRCQGHRTGSDGRTARGRPHRRQFCRRCVVIP